MMRIVSWCAGRVSCQPDVENHSFFFSKSLIFFAVKFTVFLLLLRCAKNTAGGCSDERLRQR